MFRTNHEIDRRLLLRGLGMGGLAIAAGGALSGCMPGGVKKETVAGPVAGPRTGKELVIYMNAGHVYKTYTALFAEFEKEHNIKVTVNALQWPDMQSKLTADFLSGNVPDLCEDNGTYWSARWGTAGDILALDDYISKDGEAIGFPHDFVASGVEMRQDQGHTYAIPLHLTCNGLVFYNKDLLNKSGLAVPRTWDEFSNTATSLSHAGVFGAALNQEADYSLPWLLQAGSKYYDPATKRALEPRDAAEKALQFQQDLVFKHAVSPRPVASADYSGPQKLFSSGQSAMIISGPWDIQPIKTGANVNFGIGAPLRGEEELTALAGAGLMIPARSQNADLAWELMKQMTALETELAVTKETGMTMPRKSWAADPLVKSDELLKVVAEALPLAVAPKDSLAQNQNIASIDAAYKTMYQQVVSQQRPVAEAMSSFHDAVKSYV